MPPAAKIQVDFSRDVEPLFRERCSICHGPKQQMGGLRLDSKAATLAGGNSGPVIKPGNSAGSRLIHMVAGLVKGSVMPMVGERLTVEQVSLLRGWIDQGAKWAQEPAASKQATTLQVPSPRGKHWAFNAPQRPALPNVRNQTWIRNPIDAFVLARLEAEKNRALSGGRPVYFDSAPLLRSDRAAPDT